MKRERGFFDEELRLRKISEQGDPLEKLNCRINWEMFRTTLNNCFQKEHNGPGGRPPYDYVMMFKILIIQRMYGLSDGQTQFWILDRLSFMRFLGLELASDVPDEKTIWLFRETLAKSGKMKQLFKRFGSLLSKEGIIANKGCIVDASFVDVPRQRNDRDENELIKNGEIPEEWKNNPSKLRQKDTDARWTKKNEETHYGYKDHIKVDKDSKIIIDYEVTDASVHDSQPLIDLLDKGDKGKELYADSAYSGEPIAEEIAKRKIKNKIHEKGYRGKPLTKKQITKNKKKSKTRVRVEHVFGFMTNSMRGMYIRAIGMVRTKMVIGLMNLVYNIFRYMQLQWA
jgi:IS5 family transposase